MSQPDFLYELFEDFMDDPANQDFSMDNGLVCRWMTGQAKISPKISAYYSKPSNQEKLAHTIHQNLLPLMSDCNMAIQDIYTLFIQDDSISDAKKKNLASLYKPASSRLLFLAKLISFGMERQFIKRDTKNQKLIAGGALSPIVLDYIMDSEVPKPCRHFIGRDKELEELYTMLEENRHVFLYGIAGIGKSELAQIENITADNARLVSNLHANLGGLYRMNGYPDLAREHMEKSISLLDQFNLLHINDSIPQIANYAMFLTEQQEPERGISELQTLSGIIKKYPSDDCLDYAKVQENLGTVYLMTANLSHAKTHFKKAFKIYEKIWADEPEMIEAKYREIQELYPQIGFSIGKTLSGLLTK